MTRFSLLFILFVVSYPCLSQETKTDVDVTGMGFCISRSLEVVDNTIYLQSNALCLDAKMDSITCVTISSHNLDGELKWFQNIEGRNQSNENGVSVYNDFVYTSTYGITPEVNTSVLYLNQFSTDGEILREDRFDLKNKIGEGERAVCNGHLISDGYCYLYGWTVLPNDVSAGFIIKNQLGSEEFDAFFYSTPEASSAHHMWDLSLTDQSIFIFVDNLSDVNNTGHDRKRIVELNSDLDILTETLSPDYMRSSSILSSLVTLDDGGYAYINSSSGGDSFLFASSLEQIICNNSDNSLKWKYQLPSEFDKNRGQITITSIMESSNGDIIGCGFRQRVGSNVVQSTDSYFVKISPSGELIWERFYSFPPGIDGMYSSSMLALHEIQDKKILGVGRNGITQKTALIIINDDGCLSNDDCGVDELLTKTSTLVKDLDIEIYPNPATSYLSIDFKTEMTGTLSIFDSQMRKISDFDVINEDRMNISSLNLNSGIYFLVFVDSRDVLFAKKFVVEN